MRIQSFDDDRIAGKDEGTSHPKTSLAKGESFSLLYLINRRNIEVEIRSAFYSRP